MACKFCGREIANRGSLAAHEKCCYSNPDRVKQMRSSDAGRKKGSPAWNKGLKTGTPTHWEEKLPNSEIFRENSPHARGTAKRRIVNNSLIPYSCGICGILPEWNGKPMPLVLDHINGKNDDHRLENLRFICSNCDSQLPTYKSKNRKRRKRDLNPQNT